MDNAQVSDKQVKRIVNLINKHPELWDYNKDDFISIVKGNRWYIVYFRK